MNRRHNILLQNPNLYRICFSLFWNRIVKLKYNLVNRSLSHLFSCLCDTVFILTVFYFHHSKIYKLSETHSRQCCLLSYLTDVTVKSQWYLFSDKHSIINSGAAYCNHHNFDRARFVRIWFIFLLFGHNDISVLSLSQQQSDWAWTFFFYCLPTFCRFHQLQFTLYWPQTMRRSLKWA